MGKPAKKYSQAARLHDLIRLIEARHGLSIEEMVEETGVTRRTIHRDLIAIAEAGYPLVADREENRKVYRFTTRFRNIPPITFTLPELMTLHFLRSQIEPLAGTPFADDLEDMFRKINSALPPRYAAHLERIGRISLPLLQGKRDYRPFHDILRTLQDALIHQYRATLQYRAPGKKRATSYRIDPYTVMLYKGGLYLIAFAHNRKALRTFAVERVRSLELSRERFEIPEEFSPEEHLHQAFGIVREESIPLTVRFAPAIAHAVRDRVWHPSQELHIGPDGSVTLSLLAGGRMEMLSWILSSGDQAEVLAPAELREEVRGITARLAEQYREGGLTAAD